MLLDARAGHRPGSPRRLGRDRGPWAWRRVGGRPSAGSKLWQARASCLRLFGQCDRAAASRTFCTAGSSRRWARPLGPRPKTTRAARPGVGQGGPSKSGRGAAPQHPEVRRHGRDERRLAGRSPGRWPRRLICDLAAAGRWEGPRWRCYQPYFHPWPCRASHYRRPGCCSRRSCNRPPRPQARSGPSPKPIDASLNETPEAREESPVPPVGAGPGGSPSGDRTAVARRGVPRCHGMIGDVSVE
jgi:hypothetical protein